MYKATRIAVWFQAGHSLCPSLPNGNGRGRSNPLIPRNFNVLYSLVGFIHQPAFVREVTTALPPPAHPPRRQLRWHHQCNELTGSSCLSFPIQPHVLMVNAHKFKHPSGKTVHVSRLPSNRRHTEPGQTPFLNRKGLGEESRGPRAPCRSLPPPGPPLPYQIRKTESQPRLPPSSPRLTSRRFARLTHRQDSQEGSETKLASDFLSESSDRLLASSPGGSKSGQLARPGKTGHRADADKISTERVGTT